MDDNYSCPSCNADSPLDWFDVLGADLGFGFCPRCSQEVPLDRHGDLARIDPLDGLGGPGMEEIRGCFEHFA